jgi:cyclopropane-fatty-acyl-phospholipid synthase
MMEKTPMKPTEFRLATELPHLADSVKTSWFNRLCVRILARWLARMEFGHLDLVLPDGQWIRVGNQDNPQVRAEVRLHSLRPLRRLLLGGQIGWAQGYMAGEWDSPDISALILWALGNEANFGRFDQGFALSAALNRLSHLARRNSRRGSRRNIAYHYDLGNDFYRLWLDPGMTYSSALFADPQQSLEQAQQNKYRRICDLLQLEPGQQVLEIGCGWGGFAETAATEYGSQVSGITLSREQLAWSRERIAKRGLESQCNFSLTDYRDLDTRVDRIASIEMFEAVGEENWPEYFARIKRCLKPGGLALLQIISIEDDRFDGYRRSADFIQRYIFPGGMLPSRARLQQEITHAGLELMHQEQFGADYALTLRLWRDAFLAQWPRIEAQGFDARFKRMWLYYLGYCDGGFRHGAVDVGFYLIRAD